MDRAPALQHPALVTGRRDDPVLELELAPGVDRLPHVPLDPFPVVRVDQRHVGATAVLDEVLRRIARDALDLVADQVHRPIRVERAAVDRARDVLRERREPCRRVGGLLWPGHRARLITTR